MDGVVAQIQRIQYGGTELANTENQKILFSPFHLSFITYYITATKTCFHVTLMIPNLDTDAPKTFVW
jgi:hypothetical protein